MGFFDKIFEHHNLSSDAHEEVPVMEPIPYKRTKDDIIADLSPLYRKQQLEKQELTPEEKKKQQDLITELNELED